MGTRLSLLFASTQIEDRLTDLENSLTDYLPIGSFVNVPHTPTLPDSLCKTSLHQCAEFFCCRYLRDAETFLTFPIRYGFDVFKLGHASSYFSLFCSFERIPRFHLPTEQETPSLIVRNGVLYPHLFGAAFFSFKQAMSTSEFWLPLVSVCNK